MLLIFQRKWSCECWDFDKNRRLEIYFIIFKSNLNKYTGVSWETHQGGGGFLSAILAKASKNKTPNLGVFASLWPKTLFPLLFYSKTMKTGFQGRNFFLVQMEASKNKTPTPLGGFSRNPCTLLFFCILDIIQTNLQ